MDIIIVIWETQRWCPGVQGPELCLSPPKGMGGVRKSFPEDLTFRPRPEGGTDVGHVDGKKERRDGVGKSGRGVERAMFRAHNTV